jgi:hypothetical protein
LYCCHHGNLEVAIQKAMSPKLFVVVDLASKVDSGAG